MNGERDDVEVVHNQERSRFEASVDGHQAVTEYRREGDTLVFTHTSVPPPIDSEGVGHRLVRVALDYARAEGLAVDPRCRFVDAFIRRNPEYRSLVRSG